MSWFDSVVNTVKEVSKIVTRSIVLTNPNDVACGVVPFRTGIWDRINRPNENEGNDDIGESSNLGVAIVANRARITTRARITYELDRFKMNAMLLFVQTQGDVQSARRSNYSIHDPNEIVETFINFRFEVDVNVDLTTREIDTKCREFFQKDFSEFGAVIVIVLSLEGRDGELTSKDGLFSELVILRHLTYDLNPSLLAKPKIYITETNRTRGISLQGDQHQYSLPILEQHQDVLGFHIPLVCDSTRSNGPLSFLCKNINTMADSKDFVTILKKTIEDATNANSVFNDLPMELSNNFTKEMLLARS